MAVSRARRSMAATLAWPLARIDFKSWTARLTAIVLCLGCLLFLTATRIQATKMRYELTRLHDRQVMLQAEVGRLEMELENLTRPQRIAREARRLGLVAPGTEQMIRLDE